MRSLCAVSLAVATLACASGSSSTRAASASVSKPDAQSCSPMVPAVAYRGTEVYAAPDANGTPMAVLKEDTPVCVSTEATGFGLKRVKLSNGKTGFAAQTSLSD